MNELQLWQWRGHRIGFRSGGDLSNRTLPAMVLIHGFGASSAHWRNNIPALSSHGRIFAIDLLGFGHSAKPLPTVELPYTFETWGTMVLDFCEQVVGTPAVLVGNSIGAIVAMQAAHLNPSWVIKTILINCSLRLLHEKKQKNLPWGQSTGTKVIQHLLTFRPLAQLFFSQVKQRRSVRQILTQAYGNKAAITEELLDILTEPANDPAAVDVFVAFVRYSQGPTPEELLESLPCEAIILWGDQDPWEPIELGKTFQQFQCVKAFIPVEGAGHCPQDEAPAIVNPLLRIWGLERST